MVLDITNYQEMKVIGFYNTHRSATGITLANGFIILANQWDMSVFRLNLGSSVDEDSPVFPTTSILASPYPNPFNSSTTISYSLPSAQTVSLRVYDLAGREIAKLAEEPAQVAGLHAVTWDASGVGAGVYVVRLESGGLKTVQKVVLVK